MSDDLARAYRRLLRVYPHGRRRTELLNTLLEAAPPERRRPTAGEAANLIRNGLRARLGYPRSSAVVVLSVLIALVGAWFGAVGASRLAWEFAPDLPSGAAAEEITRTALPGLKVWGGEETGLFVRQPDGEGIEYGYRTYWVRHNDATREVDAYAKAARDRFSADGWDVHDYRHDLTEDLVDGGRTSGASFWASRDRVVLGYSGFRHDGMPAYDADGGVILTLRRDDPAWLTAATWPGAVAGGVLTWLLAAWVSRRWSGMPGTGPLAGGAAAFMVVLTIPAMLFTTQPDSPGKEPWWGAVAHIGLGSLMMAAVPALLLLGGGLLVRPGPLWTAARRTRSLVRRLPRAVLGGAAVAVVAVAGAALLVPALTKVTAPPCRPAPGPPPAAPDAATGDSPYVNIYVDPASTPDQRNLIDAAIRRSWTSQSSELIWNSASPAFREVYCDGASVPSEAVAGLPYFFAVELDIATDYPALLQEVRDMPGVITVARLPEAVG